MSDESLRMWTFDTPSEHWDQSIQIPTHEQGEEMTDWDRKTTIQAYAIVVPYVVALSVITAGMWVVAKAERLVRGE